MLDQFTPAVADDSNRDQLLQSLSSIRFLKPLLNVNACNFCGQPRGSRTLAAYCKTCERIGRRYKFGLSQFEPIAFSRTDERLEENVRWWKQGWGLHNER